jgi:hypothetical protein
MRDLVEIQMIDPVRVVLENSVAEEEEWLWCIFCERFFQARHLRIDYQGNRQGCAFCRCAGFDCAIFHCTTWKDDPIWPKSVSDLRHGLSLSDLDALPPKSSD